MQSSSNRSFSIKTNTDDKEQHFGHVQVVYGQSRLQYNVEWSVTTIDAVLGTVGGFVGLIWGALALVLGGYESFKLENSLIGAVYPTSPQGREDSDSDSDSSDDKNDMSEGQAKRMMLQTVAERGKYHYNYSEFFITSLLNSFCCCFVSRSKWFKKRMKRVKRHEDACDRLVNEVDIV